MEHPPDFYKCPVNKFKDLQHETDEPGHLILHFTKTGFEKQHRSVRTARAAPPVEDDEECLLVLNKTFSVAVIFAECGLINAGTQINIPHLFFKATDTSFQGSPIILHVDLLCFGIFGNVHSSGSDPNLPEALLLEISSIQLNITFEASIFQKSGGGIQVRKMEYELLVSFLGLHFENCIFQNNMKLGSGGAIEIQFNGPDASKVDKNSFIIVQNSTFAENIAGRTGSANSLGGALSFQSQTTGNDCHKLYVHIGSSTFTNNKATDGGGAIYISDKCLSTTIANSTFKITDEDFDSPKGAFILSYSEITIVFSLLVRNLPEYCPPLLKLEMLSETAVIQKLNMKIQCHEWYNITIETNFVEQQAKEIQIICSSCPTSFYIPSDGQFFVSYFPNQSMVLVEGQEGRAENPTCTQCPVGADCPGNDLKGKPNYWGTNHDQVITMYECPADYCCTENCTGYDKCSGHRIGTLCGQCEENYSLSMLSSDCIEATTCDSHWLWPLIILAVVAYMAWYTFKDDILRIPVIIFKKMCKRCSRPSSDDDIHYVDKGYFGIVTYFIQVKAVMVIPLSMDQEQITDQIFSAIENYIQLALNFELSSTSNDICAVKDLTTTKKMIFKLLFLFGIFLAWNITYILVFVLENLLNQINFNSEKLNILKLKLINGLLEIIKYTYLGFSSIVFYSLTCTTVAKENVWYYDGSVKCYGRWQIVMMIFGLLYLVPYPFLIYVAMKLLNNRKISRKSFFLANCFPLPVLVYWLQVLHKQKAVHDLEKANASVAQCSNNGNEDVEQAIYDGFKGGFKESEGGTQYWETVLMLRRLSISATILFTNSLIQLTLCLTLCIAFQIHHLTKKPFVHYISNNAETLSLSLLCGTAAINLLKANVLYSSVSVQGSQKEVLLDMELMEIMFVVFLIGFIVCCEAGQAIAKKVKRSGLKQAWAPVLPIGRQVHRKPGPLHDESEVAGSDHHTEYLDEENNPAFAGTGSIEFSSGRHLQQDKQNHPACPDEGNKRVNPEGKEMQPQEM